jgi:hypothetical protein
MTEKRQISQGYIIRILQHFATKLRNIANFVMLFQAVVKCLSRSKFCSLGNIGPLLLSDALYSIYIRKLWIDIGIQLPEKYVEVLLVFSGN